MTTTTAAPALVTEHPGWCTNHQFSDGSADWHESGDVEVHGLTMYMCTGTRSGEPRLFMPPAEADWNDLTLTQVEDVARAILELVGEARA